MKMDGFRSDSIQLRQRNYFTRFPKFMVRYLAKILNPFQHILNLDPTEAYNLIDLIAYNYVSEIISHYLQNLW